MPILNFKGKSSIYSHHLGVPFCSLKIDKKKSLSLNPSGIKGTGIALNVTEANWNLDDNLIIHGDNLYALKALLPRYAGRVKCIYIDPPYNTGNEGWKYNDNVNSPMINEWLGKVIDNDDLEKHDKWLSMMWPRLHLLKELLSEDGVIFISIDDNEQFRLMAIMEEIFGEENCIAQITTQTNPRGRSLRQDIARTHEYILVYSKNIEETRIKEIPKKEKTLSEYKKKDKKGTYRLMRLMNGAIQFFNRKTRPNLFFPIYINPKNGQTSLSRSKDYSIEVFPISSSKEEGCWTWSKNKIKENPLMLFGEKKKTGIWRVYRKDYLPENGQATTKERSIWLDKEINHEVGKEILSNLFQKNIFDYPKSPELIKKCITLIADKNAIILDSFAGSGTTAHAVLDLNKEDGGNRKFILVECEDYANNITAERVRRVIKGVPKAKKENLKKGLGGSFTYCTLGKEMNEENLIKGKSLPTYQDLSNYVYYIATGKNLNKVQENEDFYIGKSAKNTAFFVIYKPNVNFLRSKESALNLDRKEQIKKIMNQKNCKKAVVFASIHYFDSANELAKEGIIFCQLPFAIYRVAGA